MKKKFKHGKRSLNKMREESNKYKFLIKNTLLFTIANFSNKLIVFILLPFYTAYLTTEEYAVIDLISITQQLVIPIVTLTISEAVIRFCMDKSSNKKIIFTLGVMCTFVGNFMLVIIGLLLMRLHIGNATYFQFFMLFCITISINTLLSAFLRTIDNVNIITLASIVNTLITTIFNIIFIAKMGMGINGYCLAFICGNFSSICIMSFKGKVFNFIKIPKKVEIKKVLLPMLMYSIPLIPNSIFWWINSSLDRYFLTAMSSLASVGMYAAANKIPSILNTVTSIFQQSWGLSLYKENESATKQKFFYEVFKLYNILMLLISLLLIITSNFICNLLLNKEFLGAWTWVPWLILGFYSYSVSSFIGTQFTAEKNTLWVFITTSISAIVNIILNIALIPIYGGLGAALATLISYVVLCEIRIIMIKNKYGIKINNFKICCNHILLGVISLCVCRMFSGISLLVCVISVAVLLLIQKQDIIDLFKKLLSMIIRIKKNY